MRKLFLASAMLMRTLLSDAQDSTKANPLTMSGYAEIYYSFDFGNPASHERPSFFYSFNRHNETNLNLGFVKAAYAKERVRGNLALMAGTYSQYNLAGEQSMLKNIFEANAGFKLLKTKNVWIDAGIMPSHIGFESAIGKDCWNLTRSILADNSPYYESGVKIGCTTKDEKFYLAAMYLNGWQRIQRIAGNQTPAFGTQLTYKPVSGITVNWSTFIGNEFPDSLKQYRIFNNLYGQLQITKKIGIIAGFDCGMQQMEKDTSAYNSWYAPVIIVQLKPTNAIRIAARVEYYADEKGVIITTGTKNGFQTMGYSLNFDYSLTDNLLCRIEGRALSSKDKIFQLDNKPSAVNYFITTALAISF